MPNKLKPRHIQWLVVGVAMIGLAVAFTRGSGDCQPRERYKMLAVGDDESHLRQAIGDGEFFLVGEFQRSEGEALWTLHHVRGEPRPTTLTVAEQDKNAFLSRLGWTYPTARPEHRLVVLGERDTWSSLYVYAYLDAAGRISALYVGGS